MIACFVTCTCMAQTTLFWVTDELNGADGTPDLVKSAMAGGGTVVAGDMFLMALYSTADAVMDLTDTFIAAPGFAGNAGPGVFGDTSLTIGVTPGLTSGINIFTVIFNASTIGAATSYAVVDDAPFAVTVGAPPPPSLLYDAGGIISADWVTIAVPEPSTYAMILCGIGLLAFRRYRRS